MGIKNTFLATLISTTMLNPTPQCHCFAKTMDKDAANIENIDMGMPSDLHLQEEQRKTEKEISICLKNKKDSYVHTDILESITNPKNTILEFPVSQLFNEYVINGKTRSHPLRVSGVDKNFRALMGKGWIENTTIKQKLNSRSEGITSGTKYEIGDTLRFKLINPLLDGDFPQKLSDQLQEDGFRRFSNPDESLLQKKIEGKKENNKNVMDSDYIYDIVIKKLSSGKSALALYRDGELFMATYASVGRPVINTKTGKRSAKTKRGQFNILDANAYAYSNTYKSPMPCGLKFDDGGFWIHQGDVSGYPQSHGCVRLPGLYAYVLFSLVNENGNIDIFISYILYN